MVLKRDFEVEPIRNSENDLCKIWGIYINEQPLKYSVLRNTAFKKSPTNKLLKT